MNGANTSCIWSPPKKLLLLYKKNTKAMVCSPDGNTKFFDIVAQILQGDTLTPYMFIICQNYVL